MKAVLSQPIDEVVENFSVKQDYSYYTDGDHGTWRIAMDRLEEVLEGNTVVDYVESVRATGMAKDRIPTLEGINRSLATVGWRAIVVESFIPPDVFMELQANSILPITRSIRPREQLGYTPVPDIIHEAAGHLPMLACSEYRSFLQRLGEIGAQTRMTDWDMRLYERQKNFAELVAQEDAPKDQIARAKEAVASLLKEDKGRPVSPARQLARFHWWTVEYGLIGENHRIYGAGLLSSVQEAKNYRSLPHVRLTSECCERGFDIDHIQPHYYVADSWEHLMDETEAVGELVAN